MPFLETLAVSLVFLITGTTAQAQSLTASVTLTWTATGDDGNLGHAAQYDFRYSAKAVAGTDTTSWWNAAAAVNMDTRIPAASGAKDSVQIGGLVVGLTYYAIVRVADEAGNWSGYSNLAVIDLGHGATGTESVELTPAPKLTVGAPYPSPTRGKAQLSLTLARSGPLQADVFDARGRRIRSLHSGTMEAGPHVLRWDGDSATGARAAAGVYWIRVAADEVRKTVKVVVVH